MRTEYTLLSTSDQNIKTEAEKKLQILLREEEMKWALREKVSKVVHVNDSTHFFHMIANGIH